MIANPLINISRKQAFLFATFLVFYEFLTYMANDMIMPGMIHVVASFHGEESAVATSLTMYILGGASLQLFLGPISDRYGRRPVMLTGAILFFLCTVWIASSNSMQQFLIARFFQGTGLCFIAVIGYATLQEIFSEMDAVRLIALMSNVSTIAPLIGPLVGASFIHYFPWRVIFVIIGILALLALWGLWRFMPESIGQIKRDGSLITASPLSWRTMGRNYFALIKNPQVVFGSLAIGIMVTPCLLWIALAPVMLMTVAKLSVIQYGVWQIPLFSSLILGNWFLQYLTHSYSLKQIIVIGSCILFTGLLSVFLAVWFVSSSFLGFIPGFLLYFLGLGIVSGPLNRQVLFSTSVGKGTTSAFLSLTMMAIAAGGIQGGNLLYLPGHSNPLVGLYLFILGAIYLISLSCLFKSNQMG